ncbi:HD domain-containing phosphohydrolase [Anaeroselena agilis]|uniref:Diguanylate cyclase n=1 Tax=Anaeroselena agilis TaxID=3063788 RepID=A0ABU3P0C0_9FIRM|nr:diguanylate cyclase [Selenomonadales bacterium 4137-cl]
MIFSIRAQMIAAFVVLIVLPIIVLGMLSYQKTEAILLEKAEQHSLESIENARIFFIENFIAHVDTAINTFARDIERVQTHSLSAPDQLKAEWDQYRRIHSDLPAVYFGTADGRFILSSNNAPVPGYDPRKRPWYQRALDDPDRVIWSNLYLDALTFKPIISVARTVTVNGKTAGVIGIDISLQALADVVSKIYFGQGGYAILVDQSGLIIAHPDPTRLGKAVTDEAWFWEIKNQYKGVSVLPLENGKTFISHITIARTGWKLVGFIPQENFRQDLAPIKNRTLGVGAVAAILALLLGVSVASGFATRMQSFVEAMTKVQQGDLSARWHDYSAVEFAEISDRFNAMVTTIQKLIRQEHATQHELALQKEYFEQLFENSPESIAIIDIEDRIVKVNNNFTRLFGYTFDEAQGSFINDLVVPDELREEGIEISSSVLGNRVIEKETVRKRKDGQRFDIFVLGYPIVVMGEQVGGYIIYRDISGRKEAERRLTYASTHDLLTDMYNRRYFEQEMQRLDNGDCPAAGIIISDIDGLKLVNDTLGHAVGDALLLQAARIIKDNVPEGAVLCRIGGDEFAVLLPATDEASLQDTVNRIMAAIAADNMTSREYVLSVSMGYAVRGPSHAGMDDVYREADSSMYREKLHRSNSARSALVKTLTEALHARDFITEGHADRLQELVEKLARAVGVSERRIGDLRLLAQFHDIGKVGIPDNILFKPGRLDEAETKIMHRHSEIGYRIAVASPDFHHIADWILKHHEWWNGGGYPLGLRGEDIPVECRILLIADAFDAMTQDRPYRQAVPAAEALREIAACRGTMFDPVLADIFVSIITAETEKS